MQDTLNVFQTPVDSARVALQDITSEAVTKNLDFIESIWSLRLMLEPLYLLLVVLSYYIVVKRIPGLKTNTPGRRNLVMFLLGVAWGFFMVKVQTTPYLNVLVTGMGTFAFYELVFKGLFHLAEEKLGLKLPAWYIDEVQEEKQKDISNVEALRKPNT